MSLTFTCTLLTKFRPFCLLWLALCLVRCPDIGNERSQFRHLYGSGFLRCRHYSIDRWLHLILWLLFDGTYFHEHPMAQRVYACPALPCCGRQCHSERRCIVCVQWDNDFVGLKHAQNSSHTYSRWLKAWCTRFSSSTSVNILAYAYQMPPLNERTSYVRNSIVRSPYCWNVVVSRVGCWSLTNCGYILV